MSDCPISLNLVRFFYVRVLICHSGLGTENTVSQRIQTNMHKNWQNGAAMEVAAPYNQMNNE